MRALGRLVAIVEAQRVPFEVHSGTVVLPIDRGERDVLIAPIHVPPISRPRR